MLVYGRNVAKEVLKKPEKVRKITLQKDFNDKEINSLIEKNKIKVEYLDKKGFSKFDKFSHQGIILDIEDFSYTNYKDFLDIPDAKIVILDHLEDPHNLGAIIRTCEAAGIAGIIIPKDRSVDINSTVMKTSAGALENMRIAKVTNLVNVIGDLKENGFWIVGTSLEGNLDYRDIDYTGKIALVIGNEGKGASKSVLEECDYIAKIPMYGKINSLNASVAAGIMIYEVISLDK
ncbi:MAG: 23S rRNA (guanosine(2251)-2'-O)-methyltransferase RlmB [Bacilli bacterium]|nr:23S rRNA (guanosine(2251)-2'-O)-methyltransferase RlmB [Bacilli bacterium]